MLVEFLLIMWFLQTDKLSAAVFCELRTQKNWAKTVQHAEWIILYKYSKQSYRLQGAPAQTAGNLQPILWETVL